MFVAAGIDTIDASNVKSEPNGHGYIFDTKELLSDLFYLLKEGKAPVERRLKKRTWKENLFYWCSRNSIGRLDNTVLPEGQK